MNYYKADKASTRVCETNDCGVKAVSILCDVPYHVAHRAMKKQGRKDRKGSSYYGIGRAIQSLGFHTALIDVSAKTMATISRDPEVQQGYYAVFVKQHIASVVNGKVEDWTQGRRHKIIQVLKVTPSVSRKERKQLIKQVMGA